MRPVGGVNHSSTGTLSESGTDAVGGDDVGSVTTRRGRPKTRRPPSVRAKEQRASVWDPAPGKAWQDPESHSLPTLGISVEGAEPAATVRSFQAMGVANGAQLDVEIGAMVDQLDSAIACQDFTKIDRVMEAMEAKGWRFNRAPLCFHESAWKFAHDAPCALLRAFDDELPDSVLERVIRLLDLGCDPNSSNDDDMSLLMYACKINHPVLAKLLLCCPGINPHKLNWWGKNAAMIAIEQGSVQLIWLLTQAGVSLNPNNPAIPLYEKLRAENNDTRYADLMKQLREVLADDHYASLRDDRGMTLLLRAVEDGEFAVVDMLSELEPPPNILLRDAGGKSAFAYAAAIDDDELRSDIVRCLHKLRRHSLDTVHDRRKKS